MLLNIESLSAVVLVFFLAGTVKGVIGMGLPSVAIGLLTLLFGLRDAMVMLLLPALVTNIMQAASGGALWPLARRFWPLLATVLPATWFGLFVTIGVDTMWLNAGVGVLVAIYALAVLFLPEFPSAEPREHWMSPAIGVLCGLLTGMTGTLGYPGIFYLQALGLFRARLIQAMGLLFIVSTMSLAVSLAERQLIADGLGVLSAAGVAPALAGMMAGRGLGRLIPELVFRKLFLSALFVLGALIVAKALAGV